MSCIDDNGRITGSEEVVTFFTDRGFEVVQDGWACLKVNDPVTSEEVSIWLAAYTPGVTWRAILDIAADDEGLVVLHVDGGSTVPFPQASVLALLDSKELMAFALTYGIIGMDLGVDAEGNPRLRVPFE